jgi:DNA-binding transcriptional MerR regulator
MKQRRHRGPSRDAGSQLDNGVRKAYGISEAAEALGVAPPTLRSWERRYGLLAPTRTAGNQRRYSDEDLERLTVFVALSRSRRAKESAVILKQMDSHDRG